MKRVSRREIGKVAKISDDFIEIHLHLIHDLETYYQPFLRSPVDGTSPPVRLANATVTPFVPPTRTSAVRAAETRKAIIANPAKMASGESPNLEIIAQHANAITRLVI